MTKHAPREDFPDDSIELVPSDSVALVSDTPAPKRVLIRLEHRAG